jgi:pimeloyl-ACP methyl ester carboxylesterase
MFETKQVRRMSTCFTTSPDGVRIAYDVGGAGAPIVLLHGGGQTRQDWHTTGYVEHLQHAYQVITLDIRGNGDSDHPTDPADYTTAKHCQDILAVADACGLERFTLWGYSYGGNIGRYLAAQSHRVAKLIMVGIPFGLGASGAFRRFILDFRDHWSPILQAQQAGTLDLASLSADDQDELQSGEIPVALAWLSALLEWPAIEPSDLLCPTLWLVGSRNEPALTSLRDYQTVLKASTVQVQVLPGLDHRQEFSEIGQVLPALLAFTQA